MSNPQPNQPNQPNQIYQPIDWKKTRNISAGFPSIRIILKKSGSFRDIAPWQFYVSYEQSSHCISAKLSIVYIKYVMEKCLFGSFSMGKCMFWMMFVVYIMNVQ